MPPPKKGIDAFFEFVWAIVLIIILIIVIQSVFETF